MFWISPQWQSEAVEVLSRETVKFTYSWTKFTEPPWLPACLPPSPATATVTVCPRPPKKSQLISPNAKKQITTIHSFWYYLHFSLKLLYTNLLILYNIDFPRREIMLIRISEGFTHDPIFTFELCQSDKGNMSPLSCYCILSGLRVKQQRCPNL